MALHKLELDFGAFFARYTNIELQYAEKSSPTRISLLFANPSPIRSAVLKLIPIGACVGAPAEAF